VHARAGEIHELAVDPALLVGVGGDHRLRQAARGLAGLAHIDRAAVGGFADDQ
jgi:hypothetical protein